jgi:hypothetical protein
MAYLRFLFNVFSPEEMASGCKNNLKSNLALIQDANKYYKEIKHDRLKRSRLT